MPRRRPHSGANEAAERLARALDDPSTDTAELDDDTRGAVQAARALAPAVQPREAYRIALHERIMRDFRSARSANTLPAAPDEVDDGDVPMHRLDVLDSSLGRVTLTDLEEITPARAEAILRSLQAIAARESVD